MTVPRLSDRDRALTLVPVSRETAARLDVYVDLLRRWQTIKNLIAPSTVDNVWTRHVADSLQLVTVAPDATRWIDLGAGAGFPGLVIAMHLAGTPDAHVTLVESDQRKCAFMRAVIRETGAPASVVIGRIETELPRLRNPTVHAVTARALAPLADLVRFAELLLIAGAIGVFPKGRDVERELTADSALRKFCIDLAPSRTDPEARIVLVRRMQ